MNNLYVKLKLFAWNLDRYKGFDKSFLIIVNLNTYYTKGIREKSIPENLNHPD